MESEWKVTSNLINGETKYAVYRLRGATAVDHSGNRELATGYGSDRKVAECVADALNHGDYNKEGLTLEVQQQIGALVLLARESIARGTR